MMRQAGRHMAAYRELVKKYPTFRERSEIPEVSTQISLQPWQAYKTDGVILFSDILTPLPGMGVEFTIEEKVCSAFVCLFFLCLVSLVLLVLRCPLSLHSRWTRLQYAPI